MKKIEKNTFHDFFVKIYFFLFFEKKFFCDFFVISGDFVKGPLHFPDLLRGTLKGTFVKGHLLVILPAPARVGGAADGARRGRGGGLAGAEKSFFPKNNSEI